MEHGQALGEGGASSLPGFSNKFATVSVGTVSLHTDDLLDLFNPHLAAGLFSVELVNPPVPCERWL